MKTSETLCKRTIFLYGSVDQNSVQSIVQKLLNLEAEKISPILFLINSGGGAVMSMESLLEAISLLRSPVNTLVCGRAASAAAIISVLNAEGRRFITQSSTLLLHDIQSASSGNVYDMQEQVSRSLQTQKRFQERILAASNLSASKLKGMMRNEKTITADEALKYGLVDKVISKLSEIY